MEKKTRSSVKMIAIGLALCLISMIATSILNTNFGSIDVSDIRVEVPAGNRLSALLYVPETATAENPAPAVIVIPGWWKSREFMSSHALELARRGYVVLNIDMFGHGNSDTWDETVTRGDDAYGAYTLLRGLDYVDKDQIGIAGHSSGGSAMHSAYEMQLERGDQPFASMFFMGKDPVYTDDSGMYANVYGSIDVGVLAGQYDDWYFNDADDSGEWQNAPRDYINHHQALSFLNFGEDPSTFETSPVAGQFYTRNIDGKETVRVIYTPNQIHSWNEVSPTAVAETLNFFEQVMPTNSTLEENDQIAFMKECFAFVGIVGVIMFMIYFCIFLLQTKFFAVLRADGTVTPQDMPNSKGKIWFWGSLIVSSIISFLWLVPIAEFFYFRPTDFWPCEIVSCLGFWGFANAIVTAGLFTLSYKLFRKNEGFSLRESGVTMARGKVWRTILLSVIVIIATYSIVFFADYFFTTDFRFFTLSFKAFTSERARIIIHYLPVVVPFYIINSISTNSFNYNKIGGRFNVLILALFTAGVALAYEVVQYTCFVTTGYSFWHLSEVQQALPGQFYTLLVLLFATPIISRKLYKETKNPYIGGLITGILVTILSVANATVQP